MFPCSIEGGVAVVAEAAVVGVVIVVAVAVVAVVAVAAVVAAWLLIARRQTIPWGRIYPYISVFIRKQ